MSLKSFHWFLVLIAVVAFGVGLLIPLPAHSDIKEKEGDLEESKVIVRAVDLPGTMDGFNTDERIKGFEFVSPDHKVICYALVPETKAADMKPTIDCVSYE